jgi:hypothetical protein
MLANTLPAPSRNRVPAAENGEDVTAIPPNNWPSSVLEYPKLLAVVVELVVVPEVLVVPDVLVVPEVLVVEPVVEVPVAESKAPVTPVPIAV